MTDQPALWPAAAPTLTGVNLRTCAMCGTEFQRIKGVTGVKYCSRTCQGRAARNLQDDIATAAKPVHRCHACTEEYTTVAKASRGVPGICPTCRTKISGVWNRLLSHHVPTDTIVQIIRDGAECRICDTDLLTPVRQPSGNYRCLLVVDHDHTCCPDSSGSCGRCIRGFLCPGCNAALGFLRDQPDLAIRAADYLQGNR